MLNFAAAAVWDVSFSLCLSKNPFPWLIRLEDVITPTGECSQTAESRSLSCMDLWADLQIQKIIRWTRLMKRRKVSCSAAEGAHKSYVVVLSSKKVGFGLIRFRSRPVALCSSFTATLSPKIDTIRPIQSGDYNLFLIIAAQTKLCTPTVLVLFCWSDSDLQQDQLA